MLKLMLTLKLMAPCSCPLPPPSLVSCSGGGSCVLREAVCTKLNTVKSSTFPRMQTWPKQIDQSLQLKRAGVVMLFRHCNISVGSR